MLEGTFKLPLAIYAFVDHRLGRLKASVHPIFLSYEGQSFLGAGMDQADVIGTNNRGGDVIIRGENNWKLLLCSQVGVKQAATDYVESIPEMM